MRVGEGLFWAAISLWGLFFEHPPPAGCAADRWRGLEQAAFHLYAALAELQRASDVAGVVDVVERMARACDACDRRLGGLVPPAGSSAVAEKARLHLETVRRELQRHRRAVLVP